MAHDHIAYLKRYNATECGQEVRRRALKKYNASPKGVAWRKAYVKSDLGKAALHRYYLTLRSILRHRMKKITERHLERWPDAPLTITIADLEVLFNYQKGLCALSGVKMTWGQGSVKATSLSVDRIESNRGYHLDNIRFICHAVNAFRGNGTDAEMIEMAKAIVNLNAARQTGV